MTLVKTKIEEKTILNFSHNRFSKSKIAASLRKAEVVHIKQGNDVSRPTVVKNFIKVGMYTIKLNFPLDSSPNWNKLSDYSDFDVHIFDSEDTKTNCIDLKKDPLFNKQDWVSKNFFGQLRIKHLIDIIDYCNRLDNLKCYS